MKLSIFCVLLLMCSSYVIFEQKQRLDKQSEQIARLVTALESTKAGSRPSAPTQVQAPAPQTGGWMFDKSHPDALGNSSGLGVGTHRH
jgi:hypothetical protein